MVIMLLKKVCRVVKAKVNLHMTLIDTNIILYLNYKEFEVIISSYRSLVN